MLLGQKLLPPTIRILSLRVLLGLFCYFDSHVALYSQTSSDKWRWGTQGTLPLPQGENPAALNMDRFRNAVYQATRLKSSSLIGNPESTPNRVKYTYSEKDQGIASIVPLGGAMIGLNALFASGDLKIDTDQRSNEIRESLRQRNVHLIFGVSLSQELQAAFTYRYHYIERDVYGSFFLQSIENTVFKGVLTGYSVGINYKSGDYSIGIFNAPAMRGKAEVLGEQKILSELGTVGLNLADDLKWLRLGLGAYRYYYKKDDRRTLSTSAVTERRMTLGGLDVEQYYFRTESWILGIDVPFPKVTFRTSYTKSNGVWLFGPNAFPNKKDKSQQDMPTATAHAGLRFENNDVALELAMERETREKANFTDDYTNLSIYRYKDFEAKSDTIAVHLDFIR